MANYAYRAVLIHNGSPYQNEDIGGDYKIGFFFHATITKHEKNGYWTMSNIWDQATVVFPIIFAEDNDGTLGVAPGVDEIKGRYSGVGEFTGDSIKFSIDIIPLDGDPYTKNFGWKKQV